MYSTPLYRTDSSDSGTAHLYYEPTQRKEMLDLSINKLQTLNGRSPSLRKSVLIFNTMRYLQQVSWGFMDSVDLGNFFEQLMNQDESQIVF